MSNRGLQNGTGLVAPFPYFGGKRTISSLVWRTLGQPRHFIEPFFGSGAVLLARPDYRPGEHVETVCDKDGQIANVWRALQHDPDEVARWCDWPVNHACLSARKRRLIAEEPQMLERLIADEEWYDPKLAGYWIWAASCWIGSGLTRLGQRPHIGSGTGVHALGQIPHIGSGDMGVQEPYNPNLYAWFRLLAERLRYVRVVCGDWTRVCGGDWQDNIGDVGIFFDPPYGTATRDQGVYAHESSTVAQDVTRWALERGERPSYRIVVAGYDDEHNALTEAGWQVVKWKTKGGYDKIARKDNTRGQQNRHRERLWISPHCCQKNQQTSLFELPLEIVD